MAKTTKTTFNKTGKAVSPDRERMIELAKTLPCKTEIYYPVCFGGNQFGNIDLGKIHIKADNLTEALVIFYDYLNENCKDGRDHFEGIFDEDDEDEPYISHITDVDSQNDTLWLEILSEKKVLEKTW